MANRDVEVLHEELKYLAQVIDINLDVRINGEHVDCLAVEGLTDAE
jgi:hypothetical protein